MVGDAFPPGVSQEGTGMTRSSLYRYLPPRRPVAVTAVAGTAAQRAEDVTVAVPVATAGAAVVVA